jgi:hypothetical protein
MHTESVTEAFMVNRGSKMEGKSGYGVTEGNP